MKSMNKILLLSATVGITLVGQAINAAELTPAQEGRRLFLKLNCYGCHGMTGAGGMGPKLIGQADDVPEAIIEGKEGGMPSFLNRVSDVDVANLTAYVRSLGTADEPKFLHWWEDTPSE
jgi:mono/diheme cytochrome c family protein